MLQFTKIFFAQAEQCRAIKFGVAANVVVCVGMKRFAVFVLPRLFGVVLRLQIDRAGAPVVFLARHIVAAFQQEDPLSRRGQMIRQGAASGSRPDDDYVKLGVVAHKGLLAYSWLI